MHRRTSSAEGFWERVLLYLEGAHQRFIHAHHAPSIVKLAAVVGSREQRHQLPLGKELVTIFNHLEEGGGGATDKQPSPSAQ